MLRYFLGVFLLVASYGIASAQWLGQLSVSPEQPTCDDEVFFLVDISLPDSCHIFTNYSVKLDHERHRVLIKLRYKRVEGLCTAVTEETHQQNVWLPPLSPVEWTAVVNIYVNGKRVDSKRHGFMVVPTPDQFCQDVRLGMVDIIIGFIHPPGEAEQALIRSMGGEIKYIYHHLIPAMAVTIPVVAIKKLRRNPNVTSIEIDEPGSVTREQFLK